MEYYQSKIAFGSVRIKCVFQLFHVSYCNILMVKSTQEPMMIPTRKAMPGAAHFQATASPFTPNGDSETSTEESAAGGGSGLKRSINIY